MESPVGRKMGREVVVEGDLRLELPIGRWTVSSQERGGEKRSGNRVLAPVPCNLGIGDPADSGTADSGADSGADADVGVGIGVGIDVAGGEGNAASCKWGLSRSRSEAGRSRNQGRWGSDQWLMQSMSKNGSDGCPRWVAGTNSVEDRREAELVVEPVVEVDTGTGTGCDEVGTRRGGVLVS